MFRGRRGAETSKHVKKQRNFLGETNMPTQKDYTVIEEVITKLDCELVFKYKKPKPDLTNYKPKFLKVGWAVNKKPPA